MSDPRLPSSLEAKAAAVALAAERKKLGLGIAPKVDPVAAMIAEQQAYEARRQEKVGEAERHGFQIADDFERSAGRFIANTATGLPAAVLHEAANGPNNNLGGTQVGKDVNASMNRMADRLLAAGARADESLAGGMSEVSRANEAIVGQQMSEDFAENRTLMEQRIAAGDNALVAKALRLGSDIGDGAVRTASNPTYLSNQLAGQVPTLLLGPAANLAARASVGARAAAAVVQTPARQAAARAGMPLGSAHTRALQQQALQDLRGEAARTYAGIGGAAMESSAVYAENAQAIMGADINALAQKYPGVAEGLAQGQSPEDLKHALVREVAGPAALAIAPAGFVVGKATAGLELDPLMLASRGQGLGDAMSMAMGRTAGEIIEETVQGGGAELASNVFDARSQGNLASADLLDGVGGAIGQSIPTSAGFSGVLSTPGLAVAAGSDVVDGVGEAVKGIGEVLTARVESKQAAEQAQVREQQAVATQNRRDTLVEIDTAVQAAAVGEAPTPATTALVEPIEAEPLLDDATKTLLAGGTRVQALSQVIDTMREQAELPETQRTANPLDMMLFVLKTAGQLRSRLGELDPATPEAQAISRTLMNPEVTDVEEALPQHIDAPTLERLLSEVQDAPDFATPRSQKAAEQLVVLSEVAPDQVSSEAARSVAMYQRLAPAQKAHLETVAQVAELREQHQVAYQRIGATDQRTSSIVTEMVTEKGWGEKRPSLGQFQNRIMSAMAKGDLANASKHMRALQNFARHYGNKTAAYDKAMIAGAATPDTKIDVAYRTLNAEGKLTDMPTAWLIPSKPGSQNLVEHIFNDGNTVIGLYNQLAAAYPELIKVNKTARAPLESALPVPGEPQFRSTPTVEVSNAASAPVPAAEPAAPRAAPAAPAAVSPAAAPEPAGKPAAAPVEDGAQERARAAVRAAVDQEAFEREVAAAQAIVDGKAESGNFDFVRDQPVDQEELDQVLAMSEEEYLDAVIGDNEATSEDAQQGMLDDLSQETIPEGATQIGTHGEFTLHALGDHLYAAEGTQMVGKLAVNDSGSTFAVAKDKQGRGIGKAMMRELLIRDPLHPSGGLSPAAKATRLSVLRDLRNGPQKPERFASLPKFLEAFSPREGAQSLMARIEQPMRTLAKAIKQAGRGDVSALRGLFLVQDRKIALTPEQIGGLDDLITKMVPDVIAQLNTNLLRAITEGKRFDLKTGQWTERTGAKAGGWLEAFVDGKQDVGPAEYSAAVLESGRDEQGNAYVRYQPEVAQAMALASLQWVLSQVSAPINFSAEDEASMFPDGMPPHLKEAFNTMHFAVQPTRTIANDIVRMLGMQGKKDASVTLTDGISKAMALDAITALHDGNYLTLRQEDGTELNRDKSGYLKLTFIDLQGPGGEIMKKLRKAIGSRVLTRLLDPESQELPTFVPVTEVPTKVSGSEQKLSAKQREQIRKTNAVKIYRNPSLLVFADRLGDRFLQLLGKDLVDQATLHPDYAKTVKGINEGLDYALERIQELDVMINDHAGDQANDTPIFNSHYVISNGRVMANGFTGQGDKSARELFSANKVTGDLSTDSTPLAKGYYLSLAQALGIKTELKKNAAAVAEIQERLNGAEYRALFADIQALLRGEDTAEAVFEQMSTLKINSAKAIHALVTHARLLEARQQGEANAFTTYLGFELDGKTNGPINALMHFGMQAPTTALKLLRKGGLFVDESAPRTISDDVAAGNYSDLYNDVAIESEQRFGQALAPESEGGRPDNSTSKFMLMAGLRMLSLAGHVEMDGLGRVTKITRDMAKAGMVPTTYGSGARGVANQMAHDVQAGLVKYLTQVAHGEAELNESIVKSARYIMSRRWVKDGKGGGAWEAVNPPNFSGDLTQVKFNEQHFQALVDNLVGGQRLDKDTKEPAGAAGVMREAIEDQLKPVMDTFKLVFKASRLQMFRFNEAYTAAYNAKRAELIEAGTLDKYHALSRKDEEAIRDSLKALMPAYPLAMTGGAAEGQGVFAGDKDYNGKFIVEGRTYKAASLVGGLQADINVRQYLSPGVKAAPLMTIGGGDATMMYLLTEMGMFDNTLNVYDGWEVGIDRISETAQAANNAVLGSWKHDLLGPLSASIQDVDAQDLVGTYGAEAVGEVLGVYQYRNEDGAKFETRVMEAVDALKTNIGHTAAMIQENKQELFTRKLSVDQMSGGENPATRGYTTAQLQGAMVNDAPAPVAGESAELVARLGMDYQNGLAELGQFELQALLSTFPFTDKVRRFVVMKIAHLIPDDVRVFIGTPAQIAAKQDQLFPGEELGSGQVPGVSYKGVAFLTVASEETLVHELVHLATLHLTQRHFAGAKGLTAAQRDAVRELEKMIGPFMALPARNEAMRAAQTEVRLRLDEGLPALAINEMLAWSLANTEISNQLQGTEAPGVLKKVAKTIRALVRRLLGLPQNVQIESFLDQMGSNFNRLARRPRLADTHTQLATFQRLAGPRGRIDHDAHLDSTYEQFTVLLGQLQSRTVPGLKADAVDLQRERLMLRADQELEALESSGFVLTDKEKQLFQVVQAVLGSNLQLDPAVMTEFDKLYAHALEHLDETAFLATPGSSDETDLRIARDQWNALFSDARNRKDLQGRSVLLGNFVAMALSHEGLRQALARLEPPKAALKGETFDARLRDRVTRAFDALSDRAMGTAKLANQQMHLDRLAWRLGQLQSQAVQRAARNERRNLVDRLEDKLKDGTNALDSAAEKLANDQRFNGYVRQAVQWGRGLLSDDQAAANAEMGISLANQPKVPQVFTDLASELAGNTPSTVRLHRLVNQTRHAVSRVRQQLREEAPADVRAFFKTAVSPATWAQLHRTVGQVDLQTLGSMGMSTLKNVVSDAAVRQQAIDAITAQLGPNQALYEAEGRLLAQAMVAKDVAPRYRNAEALARLFGQAQVAEKQARRLTPLLDRLVSLYALEQLSDLERAGLSSLLSQDPEGMQKLLNTMRTLVHAENRKGEQRQRYNRWKGYVPQSADPRRQVVLANAKQAEGLVKRGYKFVGFYNRDGLDPANDLAYYAVDWVGGQSTFNQGALQTVEGTLSGVDALTGQSLDPGVGTLIVNEGVVASIAAQRGNGQAGRLAPIYDQDGDVVAYERVLDPAVVATHTGGRKDLALSIGIWLGRQAEETLADSMNGQVVTALAQRWAADKGTRANEFVALDSTKDPVMADTWNTIPRHTQDLLKAAFGGGKVMIRRDMIRNAVGYRSASIADAFTGMTTLPQPVRQAIMNAVYVLPGMDYKKVVAAEKAIQGAVGTAKDWIVVRSGVVAIANGVANMFQLVASGINPLELPKLIARKAQETEIYLRNEKRLSRIRVELTATKRPDEKNKLLLERQRLLDANARLSIAPLIFAGELPTIAEGLSEHDEYTLTGDFMKWVEQKAENLPQGVLTAAKIAMITKDTALYQGLNRMIQFGDFTAKAVLYDKWIADGMAPDVALEKISERFVNYNLNAGRSRDYLESMGLLWFWNYKLRVQKIVLATLRENPLRFLLSVSGANLAGSDSLLTSSAPFVYWDYSIGPDQLFRAPEATLWHQLFR